MKVVCRYSRPKWPSLNKQYSPRLPHLTSTHPSTPNLATPIPSLTPITYTAVSVATATKPSQPSTSLISPSNRYIMELISIWHREGLYSRRGVLPLRLQLLRKQRLSVRDSSWVMRFRVRALFCLVSLRVLGSMSIYQGSCQLVGRLERQADRFSVDRYSQLRTRKHQVIQCLTFISNLFLISSPTPFSSFRSPSPPRSASSLYTRTLQSFRSCCLTLRYSSSSLSFKQMLLQLMNQICWSLWVGVRVRVFGIRSII